MMKKSKFSLDISSLVRKFCADNFEKKNSRGTCYNFRGQTSLKRSIFKDFIKLLNIETISMFKNKPTL